MPAPLLDTVRQILARDSRIGHDISASINDLMDPLYYGERPASSSRSRPDPAAMS
ncbi:MAG: hypothetical protein R3F39_13685 [Myxococcota bacterium]